MEQSSADIATWCREYIAEILGTSVESVDPAVDFDRLGIDSAIAVSLLVEIEERFGIDLPPEALFENPNINAVADYLHSRLEQDVARQ